jgi:CheY-like chemotaxis protein
MRHTPRTISDRGERRREEVHRRARSQMRSVLIVDDDFDNRRALEILLELNGYEPVAAAGGAEALAILRKRHVDVILTDWMMPVLSGADLIERIRADRLAEGIPIIVVTAAYETVRHTAPDGVRVLGKPLEIDTLLAILDQLP